MESTACSSTKKELTTPGDLFRERNSVALYLQEEKRFPENCITVMAAPRLHAMQLAM